MAFKKVKRVKDVKLKAAYKLKQKLDANMPDKFIKNQLQLNQVNELLRHFENLRTANSHFVLAQRNGWLTTNKIVEHFPSHIKVIKGTVNQDTTEPTEKPNPLSVLQIRDELIQLEDEFDTVNIELRAGKISAETDCIDLEGIELGRFRIVLNLNTVFNMNSTAFKVVAIDPNPAECDTTITHPHVRDECLCAGDAEWDISSALMEGRICDAFMCVNSVLHTYNSDSPYRRLEIWNESDEETHSCDDCGCNVHEDEICNCDNCGDGYCSDCIGPCSRCADHFCNNCLKFDEVAEQNLCRQCRRTCSACHRIVNIDDIDENTLMCPECHKEHCEKLEEEAQEAEAQEEEAQEEKAEEISAETETNEQTNTIPASWPTHIIRNVIGDVYAHESSGIVCGLSPGNQYSSAQLLSAGYIEDVGRRTPAGSESWHRNPPTTEVEPDAELVAAIKQWPAKLHILAGETVYDYTLHELYCVTDTSALTTALNRAGYIPDPNDPESGNSWLIWNKPDPAIAIARSWPDTIYTDKASNGTYRVCDSNFNCISADNTTAQLEAAGYVKTNPTIGKGITNFDIYIWRRTPVACSSNKCLDIIDAVAADLRTPDKKELEPCNEPAVLTPGVA